MSGRYSWKAITCCVSKGTLVLLAIVCVFGTCALGAGALAKRGEAQRQAQVARCAEIERVVMGTPVGGPWYDTGEPVDQTRIASLRAEWTADCAHSPRPTWVGYAVGGGFAFLIAAGLLATVCGESISYCQAAVDTHRPWYYWLPRIGNPLPPRELVACASCGHTEPETEDAYRARLGLPPLGVEAAP